MAMHKRRIKLEDGRYLIFYTFDEPAPEPPENAVREEPEPVAYTPGTEHFSPSSLANRLQGERKSALSPESKSGDE